MSVVADAGRLIALSDIGRLDLLRELAGTVLVPPAVHAEVFGVRPRACPDWISVISPAGPVPGVLDRGEEEALLLAEERKMPVLLDERRGRNEARRRGLSVTGTLGLLLEAKSRGILPAVTPLLAALKAAGYRMTAAIEREVMVRAGE